MTGRRTPPNRSFKFLALARDGVAAIEFALVAPVMVAILMGVFDLAQLLIVQRRVAISAAEVAEVASNLALQSDNSNMLGPAQLYAALSTAYAYFPNWRLPATGGNADSNYIVTISSVEIKGVPIGCSGNNCGSYVGSVAWSMARSLNRNGSSYSTSPIWDTQQTRPCGPVSTQTPVNKDHLSTLPSGAFTLSSLIIVDVSTTYKPLFLSSITGPFTFFRSAYLPPRSGGTSSYVPYSPNLQPSSPVISPPGNANPSDPNGVQACAGYPFVQSTNS